MTDTMKPMDVGWCAGIFAGLNDNGTWAVPRSGLVFMKRGDVLVLTATMPHDPAMPMSAAELVKYQNADFDIIRRHFEAAGITVIKETK